MSTLSTLSSGAPALRLGRWLSYRVAVRPVVVTAALALAAVTVAVVALGIGQISISAVDVVRTLVGNTDPVLEKTVGWRLPRVAIALVFGAALGIGGAIFQSLTRNALGSPDVIGFDAGAYTGAIITIVAVGTTALVVPGAVIGGVATALAVYLLAYQRGVQGFRLIVVGIGLTSMLGALNTYLILTAELYQAQMAALWGAGSINGLDWTDLRVAALALVPAAVPLLWLGRRMRALELGDDAARALGVRIEPVRLGLIVCGAVLTATVTALAGPIAFVSLAAPQLARRLTRAPGVQLLPSAAMGALLLITCDTIGLHAFSFVLPVGLLTIVIGGCYLVWLLLLQTRRETV